METRLDSCHGRVVRFRWLVNGEMKGTSGLPSFGVLSQTLSWVRRDPNRAPSETSDIQEWVCNKIHLRLGGLDSTTDQHVDCPDGFKSLGQPGPLMFEADHFLGTMAMIGLSVGTGWMLLLISGRWRPEPSWIDRAGRVLGWFSIATLPLTCWFDFNVFL
jgi:hypothetical protein